MYKDIIPVCPPRGNNRVAEVYNIIDRWSKSDAMSRLVTVFRGDWHPTRSLDEHLKYLVSFSERWDFRRGAERLQASAVQFEPPVEELIRTAVAELGLTRTSPPRNKFYDYILVLGGVALSCRLRVEHAAEILRGDVDSRAVVLLGANRRIPESERADADTFAPGAETEFDLLNSVAESAFMLKEGFEESVSQNDNENLVSKVRRYRDRQRVDILSLCAPSSQPNRRANTEDTYEYMAQTLGVKAGETFLICTSQIYYPFHLMGAMRILALPHDVEVEVVGFPTDRASGSSALRGLNNLLQEIRSAIQAGERLKEYLDRQ